MENIQTNSPSSNLHEEQVEDTYFRSQLKTIFNYLKDHVATASMVSEATGIPQKNICRYKRDLERVGRLWEVDKKPCKRTGHRAWYLTTDPDKTCFGSSQLELF